MDDLKSIVAGAIAILLCCEPAAYAQSFVGNWNFGGGWVESENVNAMNKVLSAAVQSRADEATPPAESIARDDDLTGYTLSTARRQANYSRFVEATRRADPAGAKDLAATLASDPIATMAPELAKIGLRTNDVADAYAVYWVEAWEAVHGQNGHSSRETAQVVRAQVAAAMMTTLQLAHASDAQKQELADALLVQALLIGAAREQAGSDPLKLRQIATSVRQGAKATGLDLEAMRLTRQGFLPLE